MLGGETQPSAPTAPLKLEEIYHNNIKRPYGDVVRPPYPMRWRHPKSEAASSTWLRFIDLSATSAPVGYGTFATCRWDRGVTSSFA